MDSSGEALFRISNTLIGERAVAPDSFAFCGKEPVFLTGRGVYAITAEELTGEKYSQERSYYIGNALQEAVGKAEACGIVYRDFYVLSLAGNIYLLDLQQKYWRPSMQWTSPTAKRRRFTMRPGIKRARWTMRRGSPGEARGGAGKRR